MNTRGRVGASGIPPRLPRGGCQESVGGAGCHSGQQPSERRPCFPIPITAQAPVTRLSGSPICSPPFMLWLCCELCSSDGQGGGVWGLTLRRSGWLFEARLLGSGVPGPLKAGRGTGLLEPQVCTKLLMHHKAGLGCQGAGLLMEGPGQGTRAPGWGLSCSEPLPTVPTCVLVCSPPSPTPSRWVQNRRLRYPEDELPAQASGLGCTQSPPSPAACFQHP